MAATPTSQSEMPEGEERESTQRSLSLPASVPLGVPGVKHARDDQNGMETSVCRDPRTEQDNITDQSGMEILKKSHSSEGDVDDDNELRGSGDLLNWDQNLSQHLPTSFDFTPRLSQAPPPSSRSVSSTSEEFHTPEEGSPRGAGPDERRGVFVFSGSSSPLLRSDDRRRRRRNAAVPPPPGPLVGAEPDDDKASSREVAMLTQQLELASDDVS